MCVSLFVVFSMVKAACRLTPRPYHGASTLVVTSWNVGVMKSDCRPEKIKQLAKIVKGLLQDGPGVVGINDIHQDIAMKVVKQLCQVDPVNICLLYTSPSPRDS